VELHQITSEALVPNLLGDSSNRPYRVYLPPSYDRTTAHYPVVYVLHGFPEDETELLSPLQTALDSTINLRRSVEFIAVFVNGKNRLGGSWYMSSPVVGDNETYIVKDLVAEIDSRYRTLATRESRAIHGFSIGAWGAMHLALKYPNVFSVVVAESGTYDSRSSANDSWAQQLAAIHPTNLVQFAGLSAALQGTQAWYAGLLPNTNRPGLYTDYVYEWQNGKPVFVPSADQRCRQADIQNGDLAQYTNQPIRLNAIKLVHGVSDDIIPISDARSFTNALTSARVPFAYQEHSGSHDYRPDLAIPFLSANLQGGALYIAAPRLSSNLTTNGVELVFATQSGVEYRVQARSYLGTSQAAWIDLMLVKGNGIAARVPFTTTGAYEFYRVTAANSP
jgi:S-formylglutathione hydrolase FrmB